MYLCFVTCSVVFLFFFCLFFFVVVFFFFFFFFFVFFVFFFFLFCFVFLSFVLVGYVSFVGLPGHLFYFHLRFCCPQIPRCQESFVFIRCTVEKFQ